MLQQVPGICANQNDQFIVLTSAKHLSLQPASSTAEYKQVLQISPFMCRGEKFKSAIISPPLVRRLGGTAGYLNPADIVLHHSKVAFELVVLLAVGAKKQTNSFFISTIIINCFIKPAWESGLHRQNRWWWRSAHSSVATESSSHSAF